jgi:hypothetical protein
MMRVDVDDQNVVEVALVGLLARMRKEPRGVEFLDRYAAAAVGDQIQGVCSKKFLCRLISISSLRAERSNPVSVPPALDCFVALLLAMTTVTAP